jgi:hypothetical protein
MSFRLLGFAPEQFVARDRLRRPFGCGAFGRSAHPGNQFIPMIVEIRQRGIDFFRPQVRMLSEEFIGRPAVEVVFRRKVQHLLARVADPGDAVGINGQMRIQRGG